MDQSKYIRKIQGIFFEETTLTLGTGSTQKTQKMKNYCQAEQIDSEKVKLSFLGNEGKPTGIVIEIAYDEFLKRYTFDPNYRVKTKNEAEHDRHVAVAEKQRARGEVYSAELEYSTALKIDPESIRANFGIGTLYMEMGDTAKAKAVFKKLSEVEAIFEEDNKHIFNEFGIELRKANMLEEALSNYQKAVTISPQDEHLYFNVARIYYDIKEWNNALTWLKKALEINPHFRDAMSFQSLISKEMAAQGITPKDIEEPEAKAVEAGKLSDLDKELLDTGLSEKPQIEVKKTVAPTAKQPVKR